MTALPTLRLSYLRTWPGLASVSRGLGQLVLGKVLWLPTALGREELEELVDTLVLLLGLPVAITADPSRWQASEGKGAIVLIPSAVVEPPAPIRESVVLCTRERVPGNWSLNLPREVLLIRDAVIECIGRQLSASGLARVASWVASVADTPATAIRFVDGVQAHLLKNPKADDGSLYCAGLAAVLDWMLMGVDARVVQWLLTLAFGGTAPERRISTDAALLGRLEALRHAFDQGLLYQVPQHDGDPLDLRRPLDAIGRLESAPGRPTQAQLAEHLGPRLPSTVRQMLERLVQPTARGLGLPGPAAVRLIGRDEIVKRLTGLLEPSERIQTCVLYGVAGCGKTAVAASVAQVMEHRLEPVWINFTGGPLAGWLRVAVALGLDTQKPLAERKDKSGVPRWVRDTQARLAEGTYLLVVDDVDEIEEELLQEWLPSGQGRCAVLVLSRSSQKALQRAHDAISIHVPLFSLEDARHFVELRTPNLATEIAQGRADALIDRVGRHPGALMLLCNALGQRGIQNTLEALSSSAQEVDVIPRVLQDVVESLGHDEQAVLRAVWICSPGGSRVELVKKLSEVDGAASIVEWLVDRGLIVQRGRTVRLEVLVRLFLDRLQAREAAANLFIKHASLVSAMMEKAFQYRDYFTQGDVYLDLLFASDRMMDLVRQGRGEAVEPCVQTGSMLRRFPLGGRESNLRRAIASFRSALEVWTRESFPENWAMVHNNLGIALGELPTGNREDNLWQAIASFRSALEVWTRESFPENWARAHNNLGNALVQLPTGNREENLRQAIAAYQSALEVLTRESSPEDWAMAHNNLGIALLQLPAGNREENLRQAIAAYQSALEVWSRESSPEDWAMAHNNLGIALRQLPAGNREENLRQAIASFRSALEVWTRESFPENWATAHNNLGITLRHLPTGNREENLRQTIASFRSALEVWTRESFPENWARVHNNLGNALSELPTGNREENLRQAIAAYQSALEVWTRESFPGDWAKAHNNQGNAFAQLPTGNREENLRQAIAAYQSALEVWTYESFPEDWAMAHNNLESALHQLSAISSGEAGTS
ncbi:NB-ARC domain-containing protein [Cystobacter fuscus]|uniref:NB-ARC domain-containing protein n=1 Tax=Cystobacter fuscus TaxID=43 RepID=UPI002B2BA7F8|nr:tetratricopeptide repeat protein [Cystobacter fuscus]